MMEEPNWCNEKSCSFLSPCFVLELVDQSSLLLGEPFFDELLCVTLLIIIIICFSLGHAAAKINTLVVMTLYLR